MTKNGLRLIRCNLFLPDSFKNIPQGTAEVIYGRK